MFRGETQAQKAEIDTVCVNLGRIMYMIPSKPSWRVKNKISWKYFSFMKNNFISLINCERIARLLIVYVITLLQGGILNEPKLRS